MPLLGALVTIRPGATWSYLGPLGVTFSNLIHAMQFLLRKLCYAIFTMQSLLCNHCYAIFAMQSLLCNLCYAIFAIGPSRAIGLNAMLPCMLDLVHIHTWRDKVPCMFAVAGLPGHACLILCTFIRDATKCHAWLILCTFFVFAVAGLPGATSGNGKKRMWDPLPWSEVRTPKCKHCLWNI